LFQCLAAERIVWNEGPENQAFSFDLLPRSDFLMIAKLPEEASCRLINSIAGSLPFNVT
jgi:hypothetical protein